MKKHIIHTISAAKLQEYVTEATSFTSLYKLLGVPAYGGRGNNVIKARLAKDSISFSHFSGKRIQRKHSNADVFSENTGIAKAIVRARYKQVSEYKCARCPITDTWHGDPISLQLDHMDGNHNDDRLTNLRWLCPNCHSQTENYAGRGKRKPL